MVSAAPRLGRQVLGLFALFALLLGVIGFGKQQGYSSTLLDRFYSATQLFFLEYNAPSPPDNWELNLARFLSPAIALYAAGIALSSAFRDELQNLRARFVREHTVIAGLESGGRIAAAGFRRRGKRIVGIDFDNAAVRRVRAEGQIAIRGDACDKAVLANAGLTRASHLVVLGESDERNAEIVAAARRLIDNTSRLTPLRCMVQIANFNLEGLLTESRLSTYRDSVMGVEFFNVAARGAQVMLAAHPAFDDGAQTGDREPHVLVVGLGEMGGTLVALLALQWRVLETGRRLRVTVAERRADANVAELCNIYRGMEDVVDLEPVNVDVRAPEFENGDAVGHAQYTIAYVLLGEDGSAFTAALALRRNRTAASIVVRTTTYPNLAALVEQADVDPDLPRLHVFEALDRVCDPDVLMDSQSELIAKAIHARHLRGQKEQGRTDSASHVTWENLAEEYKDSSRQSARHIPVKLAAVGCKITRFTDWAQPVVTFTENEVESMSELEHERWVTERATKQPDHPSLVPWALLPDRDREYDRELVRDIPRMLADVGFTIIRVEEAQ